MAWAVEIREAAIKHLEWFGKAAGRKVLKKAIEILERDPLAQSRNLKTLRPNPFAHRELRIFGKYRVLFSVDADAQRATILLVGEKRGNRLLVEGEEFTDHHESDPSE
jgi:mRNA-degrading endonuclease RelE of RelBE toxin-antitoxin system